MQEFSKVTIKDHDIIKQGLNSCDKEMCDYAVSCFYMWSFYYDYEYMIYNDQLIIRGNDVLDKDKKSYMLPIGSDIFSAIDYLFSINNNEVTFNGIDDIDLEFLKNNYECSVTLLDGYSDYVYSALELSLLKGEKFKKKRNLVNKFHKAYNNIVFKEISDSDISSIIQQYVNWYDVNEMNELEKFDFYTTMSFIKDYSLFELKGAMLIVDDKIIAFSFYLIKGDMAFVHIEKANKDIFGSYQAINNYVASLLYEKYNVKYLNREEDMQDEGLRKAKMSYNPIKMINKYKVVIKKSL